MNVNFVCVRVGSKYGPEYVEILTDMLARNASRLEGARFWCLTDDPSSLPAGVTPIAANPDLPGWWQKVFLFSKDMPWGPGERVVYVDLDVAITGRLEDLVERKGIIRDWLWPCYNSSLMVWDHGEHAEIWASFLPQVMTAPGDVVPAECLPAGEINGGDQEWITEVSERAGGQHWPLFPERWCVSYRDTINWPAADAKVISFNGAIKPHMVTEGWVPDVWKVGGFTSLPVMDGANVTPAAILENIAVNIKRNLPWFQAALGPDADRGQVAVLVGGGPSMLDNISAIRAHRDRGARIVTVNNAWRVLVERGITPDTHVMLDARPENAAFIKDAPAATRYLLASQCHPAVFEALADRTVVLWHNGWGDNKELIEALGDYWRDGPDQKPCVLVPGGGTVGLRTLWLCFFSGYRKVHVYGMDSSYEGEAHHAYAQPLNDDDAVQTVALRGKKYLCARWMVRQAEEFRQTWFDLASEGVTLFVHGRGLIPDMARILREGAAA